MAEESIKFSGKDPAKILKWKVRHGSEIQKGSILCLYKTENSELTSKFKATKGGTVLKCLLEEGCVVNTGEDLVRLQGCMHATVMKDLCALCGANLRNESGRPGDRIENVSASVAMVHSVPELIVSEAEARKIGREDESRLLRDRKLVLLVDLDQTLLHTTNDQVPVNLKDVHHFQMWHGPNLMWYHTKFRPNIEAFLANISKMYELHICTFGVRVYAHIIAKLLDPEGQYFSHRILSRDECFNPTSKTANLRALFPCGDSMVAIIDDREDVWNFSPNLIHVKPYGFFSGTADINAPPGLDKSSAEGQTPDLKRRKSRIIKVPKFKDNTTTNATDNMPQTDSQAQENCSINNESSTEKSSTEKSSGVPIDERTDANKLDEKMQLDEGDTPSQEETKEERLKSSGKPAEEEDVPDQSKDIDMQSSVVPDAVEQLQKEEGEVTKPEDTGQPLKVKDKTDDAVEAKVDNQMEAKQEGQTESKVDSQTESKVDGQTGSKADGQTESKADSQTGLKADGQTESKVDGQTGLKADGQTESKVDGQTESKVDGQTGSKADGQTGSKADGQTESKVDGQTGLKADGQTESKADGQTESKADGQTESKVDGQTGSKVDGQTESKVDGRMDSKADSQIEAKDDGKTESKDDGQTDDLSVSSSSEEEGEISSKDQADEDCESKPTCTSEAADTPVSASQHTETTYNETSENQQKADSEAVITHDGTKEQGQAHRSQTRPGDDTAEYDEMVEWDDPDDYLLYLEDILTRIHTAFYECYDQTKNRDSNVELPSLKKIIPYVHKKVLKHTNIVFSGVFPTNMPAEKSRAYIVAKALGAEVQSAFVAPEKDGDNSKATTHVVAARPGTQKVKQGRKHKKVHVVAADWLWSCADRWERVDERLYILKEDPLNAPPRDSPDPSQSRTDLRYKKRKSDDEAVFLDSSTGQVPRPAKMAKLEGENTNEEPQPSTSTSGNLRVNPPLERRFSESYNPMLMFSRDDIDDMDKEVEDILDASDSESEEEDEEKQEKKQEETLRIKVLKASDDSSSDADSLSGDFPRGWKRKFRKNCSPKNAKPDSKDEEGVEEEQMEEEPADQPNRILRHSSDSDSEESDQESFDDSIGSADDEMAAAVEKEFLNF